ncbi:DNA cytosine methyltransferase [Schaalia canis]|uniref:Cytosine-specific methyltransferase n=1 Tax=Schaalia canis TaxID=100469 RepID=A0A3P1SEV9_9ACTO|nr:DNA cytosine methyltransferase [Schaalia canis]
MTISHSSIGGGPTFVSLYSGAGGLDLGFAAAGFVPVFANDIDPWAVRTHNSITQVRDSEWRDAARRFEYCEAIAGDVRDLGDHFEEGMADVVIGGPPCQGFSVAGRMDPNDPRSKHVFDFLGIVAKVRPKAFVMENVAALARNSRWGDVIASLREIASVDYDVNLIVLNASHWGVAQSRERMFLIGTPRRSKVPNFEGPPTQDAPPTVRSVLEKLPELGIYGNHGVCTAKITLARRPVLRRSPYAGMLFNGQGRVMNLDAPAPTLPASMGGNRTPIVDQESLKDPRKTPWIELYHDRLFVERKPPLSHLPEEARLRRITVQEAAAIQSFPSDMVWTGTQSAQYRQIGNAVPPRLAAAVATRLREAVF